MRSPCGGAFMQVFRVDATSTRPVSHARRARPAARMPPRWGARLGWIFILHWNRVKTVRVCVCLSSRRVVSHSSAPACVLACVRAPLNPSVRPSIAVWPSRSAHRPRSVVGGALRCRRSFTASIDSRPALLCDFWLSAARHRHTIDLKGCSWWRPSPPKL